MEHPNVIRDIDALIDSYNWDAIRDSSISDHSDLAPMIKELIRASNLQQVEEVQRRLIWSKTYRFRDTSLETFVILQLLIKLLRDFHLGNKDHILNTIAKILYNFNNVDHFVSHRTYRFLHHATSFLVHFLHHHKAAYRLQAAQLVPYLRWPANEIALIMLGGLKRERSIKVTATLTYQLAEFLKDSKKKITLETKQMLLSYAEKRIHSKSPLVAVATAILYLTLTRDQLPSVLEHVRYALVRVKHNLVSDVMDEFFFLLPSSPSKDKLQQLIDLLSKSRSQAIVVSILQIILFTPFYHGDQRWIVITATHKLALEQTVACRAFWSTSRYNTLTQLGFEPTRSGLRQQIAHMRIIDTPISLDDMDKLMTPQTDLPIFLIGAEIQVRG